MTANTTIQALAAEARSHFERKIRDDGTASWSRKDDSPEWVQELVFDAHGDMMPDDWRYVFIVEALEAIEEADDPDDITMEADIYTADLCAWLASRFDRPSYCDEANEEYGGDPGSIVDQIGLGQVREKEEVLALVRSFLDARLEEIGAAE